jgi:pimeloyl-ACP methyl ester carboxylesterase
MSAAIASVCAAAFPDRVTQLVLVDGFGPWSQDSSEIAKQLRSAITTANVLASKTPRPYESFDVAVDRLLQNNKTLARESARLLVARGTTVLPDGTCQFRHDIRLNAPSVFRYSEEQVLELLKKYVCATRDCKQIRSADWYSPPACVCVCVCVCEASNAPRC